MGAKSQYMEALYNTGSIIFSFETLKPITLIASPSSSFLPKVNQLWTRVQINDR